MAATQNEMLSVFSEMLYSKYIKCTVRYSLVYNIKYHLNQDMRGETNLSVSQFYSFGENTLKYIHSKYVRSWTKSVSNSEIKPERIKLTHCVEISS